eukprot:9369249-Pyramimonas_sp.AAC.1
MLVRRARQHKDLTIRFFPIPLKDIRLMIHADFAKGENDGLRRTQGGYVLSVTDPGMQKGA